MTASERPDAGERGSRRSARTRVDDLLSPEEAAAFERELVEQRERVVAAKRSRRSDRTRGLQRRLYDECVTAGWDPNRGNTFAEECAHLHEEVSEAFRAWRLYQDAEVRLDPAGKPQGVPIELADVLIGLFYNAEVMGFDLLDAVEVKHRYNLKRDYVAEGRQLHARPEVSRNGGPDVARTTTNTKETD